jgi:hypothetical protein
MNLNFNTEQMITSLTKLGYEVRDETVTIEDKYTKEDVAHKVYNIYLHGENSCPWGALGTYRLEYVFNREMERKLLNLF